MAETQATAQPETSSKPMGIEVTKDGPYHVTGPIPLDEKVIVPVGHHYELRDGEHKFPQSEDYWLCRCGRSGNAPFCDGTHAKVHFNGTEVADRRPFADRVADTVEGSTMTLLDDDRCAYARFCHRDRGDVWQLTQYDSDPANRREAIIGVSECVAGRLVEVDDAGNALEKQYPPEISALQDEEEAVSGPLYVRGPIPMVSGEGGDPYEVRNRMALCRCGASKDKPFCDATHVRTNYRDSLVREKYGEPRERAVGFAARSTSDKN